MSFAEQVREDVAGVFLNLEEFGEKRTIRYDGEVFEDVPVVISERRQSVRPRKTRDDRIQGLYLWDIRVHAAVDSLGGKAPERGSRLLVSTASDNGFMRGYYVNMSKVEMGLVIMELEEIDE